MVVNYTYLLVDAGVLLVPLIFTFHPKIQFHHHWKAAWSAILISALPFVVWDISFTGLGIWGFNQDYLTGINVYNLPFEEVLFFICIPYASMFTYFCFEKFNTNSAWLRSRWIAACLAFLLLIAGIVYLDRHYTSVTFISLSIVTLFVSFPLKAEWLSRFYLMFLLILIPFFIVNGLLTGTGLKEAVVWYNDNENMQVRILTIPIEDIFYAMLLLLLNTLFFEHFRKKMLS